jgi:MFS family permease
MARSLTFSDAALMKEHPEMDGKGKKEARLSLALTAAGHGMNHAIYNMFPPLTISLSEYFHFHSLSKVTIGFTLYLFFYGVCQVPLGFIADRASRKILLGSGLVLTGIAVSVMAAIPDYRVFLIGLSIAGAGGAAYHPVAAAYMSDLYSSKKGTAFGISGIGATVGLTLGPIIGGAMNKSVGWRITFVTFAAGCVLLGLIFMKFAIEPEREKVDVRRTGAGWSRGLVIVLIIAATVFTFREFAGWGGYYLIPVFSEMVYKYSSAMAGFVGGLQSAGGFIAQPLGGWLSDRFGRRRLMSFLLFLCVVFIVLIPIGGQRFLIPTVVLYGLAYTATVPIIDALIADRTPSSIRGSVLGIFMASGIGIGAFSQYVQARVIDATHGSSGGFLINFLILAGCVTVALIVMIFFRGAEKDRVTA